MEKEFVPYTEALELKQLGFDIPSVSGYSYSDSDNLLTQAILYQQAFRWFREKYNLFGQVNIRTYYIYEISNDGIAIKMASQYDKLLNTYEEAELECLKKLIELIKQKQL